MKHNILISLLFATLGFQVYCVDSYCTSKHEQEEIAAEIDDFSDIENLIKDEDIDSLTKKYRSLSEKEKKVHKLERETQKELIHAAVKLAIKKTEIKLQKK